LNERKRELQAESDLNRLLLRVEVMNLRMSLGRVDHGMATAWRMIPWMLPVVSAGGWLMGRGVGRKMGLGRAMALLLKVLPALYAFVRR
jgi:hypothetical protein